VAKISFLDEYLHILSGNILVNQALLTMSVQFAMERRTHLRRRMIWKKRGVLVTASLALLFFL
jgi:hypothetical protein